MNFFKRLLVLFEFSDNKEASAIILHYKLKSKCFLSKLWDVRNWNAQSRWMRLNFWLKQHWFWPLFTYLFTWNMDKILIHNLKMKSNNRIFQNQQPILIKKTVTNEYGCRSSSLVSMVACPLATRQLCRTALWIRLSCTFSFTVSTKVVRYKRY